MRKIEDDELDDIVGQERVMSFLGALKRKTFNEVNEVDVEKKLPGFCSSTMMAVTVVQSLKMRNYDAYFAFAFTHGFVVHCWIIFKQENEVYQYAGLVRCADTYSFMKYVVSKERYFLNLGVNSALA